MACQIVNSKRPANFEHFYVKIMSRLLCQFAIDSWLSSFIMSLNSLILSDLHGPRVTQFDCDHYHELQMCQNTRYKAGLKPLKTRKVALEFKGSGALLVRLYKDAGAPSLECSLTKFWKAESKVLGLSLTYYNCFLDIGTVTIESAPHPLVPFRVTY